MHRIIDVRCIYFGMIGSKWQKRSLSPQYIHYVSFLIYPFVYAAVNTAQHTDIIYTLQIAP